MSRAVNLIFALAFVLLAVGASVYLYRDYQHLDKQRSEEAELARKLELLEQENQRRERSIVKMEKDSEYVEKVIRDKLNYAKEDEVVFRFE